jgi:hypothetical protein
MRITAVDAFDDLMCAWLPVLGHLMRPRSAAASTSSSHVSMDRGSLGCGVTHRQHQGARLLW